MGPSEAWRRIGANSLSYLPNTKIVGSLSAQHSTLLDQKFKNYVISPWKTFQGNIYNKINEWGYMIYLNKNKIIDLFKVKLYTIRSWNWKKRKRERDSLIDWNPN